MRRRRTVAWAGLLSVGLLAWTGPAFAQTIGMSSTSGFSGRQGGTSFSGGGGGFSGGGGSFSGGGGGFSGGGGGFSGGSSFSGGFSGGGSMSGQRSNLSFQGSSFSSLAGQSWNNPRQVQASYGVYTPFGPYYANPLSMGAPAAVGQVSFGQPLFGAFTSTTAISTGLNLGGGVGLTGGLGGSRLGGTGFSGGLGGLTGSTLGGFTGGRGGQGSFGSFSGGRGGFGSMMGQTQAMARYTITANMPNVAMVPTRVTSDIQTSLTKSTRLSSSRGIQVLSQGPSVVLRGTVPSEQDRRLAENLARLTPGVRDVVNELEIVETVPQPRRLSSASATAP